MNRIMVVDDEAFITDGLAYMLEGLEEFALEVSRAYSAKEALALLNSHVYDIVVTDIQMPGMTGLELLREVHEKWPSCYVVFLTGYDEFDYARQALKYGAYRFILKNEGDHVLVQAIRECIQQIQQDAMRTKVPDVLPARRQITDFLRSLVVGGASEPKVLQGELDALDLQLRASSPILLMMGRVDKVLTDALLASIGWIVRDKAGHAIHCAEVKVDRYLAFWFIQPVAANNEAHARVAITDLAELIQETCYISLGVSVSFVLDPDPVIWVEIPSRAAHIYHVTATYLQQKPGIAMASIAYFSGDSLLFFREDKNNSDVSDPTQERNFFVNRLQQYIQSNLEADLSLTALSEYVYLNPAYLSRRYKELTNHNITEVILQMRMEKAEELLRDGEWKIGQISVMVGYESAAHFSRVFKKHLGLTPQEYRTATREHL